MINRRYTFSGLIALTALWAMPAVSADLELDVRNVRNAKGSVFAWLCEKEQFLKQCAFSATAPAADGKILLKFKEVPAGRYAISAYHDENGNKKFDKNFLGIPTEGYGFSRDVKVRFGPPQFEDAAFEIKDGGNLQELSLNY